MSANNNVDPALEIGQLWVAGKVTNVLSDGWDFIGVFSEETKAIAACEQCHKSELASDGTDEPDRYFIAPATLDQVIDCTDNSDWEGGYFPLKTNEAPVDLFADDQA